MLPLQGGIRKSPPDKIISYIVNTMAADDLGILLLTWFNCNPSMDKQLHPL